jgi:23S rRNA pseudouridine1911/1915/1917 synthase
MADKAPAAAQYTVEDSDAGARLDRFLVRRIETLSRARVQDLIRGGHVISTLPSGTAHPVKDPNRKVRAGESFVVAIPEVEPYGVIGEQIALDIVYEDECLIVINKPAGLVVHPGAGNEQGTLVNALIAYCGKSLSGIGGIARPGIVHRLDKDTSGLMVIAKDDATHRNLAAQFADHGRTGSLRREYLTLVWGEPSPRIGRIESRIARSSSSRVKMTVVASGGRVAITNYQTERVYRLSGRSQSGASKGNNSLGLSVVRCNLETGRTHQVRVHMAHIGAPIVGDALYAAAFRTKAQAFPEPAATALSLMDRQALHAVSLQFAHPKTGKIHVHEAKLASDIAQLCKILERLETKLSKN